ncbi:MAG: XRE family transcriptional regulator [Desulfobacteraceae bacterium]|nr:MAG: XRE family transcriptional regulator [Desulfobacteraceae bacterium]
MDLYLARATKRISQLQLALKIGISQTQLSLFERGYREPPEKLKQKIADALGISVDDIQWTKPEHRKTACGN